MCRAVERALLARDRAELAAAERVLALLGARTRRHLPNAASETAMTRAIAATVPPASLPNTRVPTSPASRPASA